LTKSCRPLSAVELVTNPCVPERSKVYRLLPVMVLTGSMLVALATVTFFELGLATTSESPKCAAVTSRTQTSCARPAVWDSVPMAMNSHAWSSSVGLSKSLSPRRFSMPTFWIAPGQLYLRIVPPPNCCSKLLVNGESMKTRSPSMRVTTRSMRMFIVPATQAGSSPIGWSIPTASIHAWLLGRSIRTVSPTTNAPGLFTRKLLVPTGTVLSIMLTVEPVITWPPVPATRINGRWFVPSAPTLRPFRTVPLVPWPSPRSTMPLALMSNCVWMS